MMKILIVGNLYPPHYVGGYELRCSQVAEFLRAAGHEVRVLTSSYRLPAGVNAYTNYSDDSVGGIPVERSLRHYGFHPQPAGRFYTLAMARQQLRDTHRFIQILDDFRPDIVNWWNLEGVTKTILPIPAAWHIPDVHCLDDTWIIREYGHRGENDCLFWFDFWQGNWGPSFFRPLLRRALAPWKRKTQLQGIPMQPFPNNPRHVCFISEFMRNEHRQAGLEFLSSEVVYGGVSPELFYAQRPVLDYENGRLRLLYAGYLEPNRGLHTIVEGLGLLPQSLRDKVELSITHTGPPEPGKYVEEVKKRIERLQLSKAVTFLGTIRHEEMPRIYREHHVVVSASVRKEGLPLIMMEAMCAGCAVITTGSGGAAEIADLADLPIFPKDHPLALSMLIARLVRDRELVYKIAKRGQEVVLREFTFARMMERLCSIFQMLCDERKKNRVNSLPT